MASEDWTKARSVRLTSSLQRAPYNFDFFQAVRIFECVNPERPRVGYSIRSSEDPVFLGQDPSLAFAPTTLSSFIISGKQSRPQLRSYFFGLLGPNGPLPLHLTEYAYDRIINSRDPTFSRFLDIFHHRMLSLFYRAWADVRPAVSFDRPNEDQFGEYVASVFGLGMESLRNRDLVPDVGKLYFAGRFACQTRNAEGLIEIIKEYFGVTAKIEEFVGEWINLPRQNLCYIRSAGDSSQLGSTAILGLKVWGCQHKFRIAIRSVDFSGFQKFLPGSKSMEHLMTIVKNYIGDELNWDLKLILSRDKAPTVRLGKQGRLGWTSWLGLMDERPNDDEEVIFSPLTTAFP
jgi:type VI secretion system protein ImpH